MKKQFEYVIKEQFKFLEKNYNFQLIKSKKDNVGYEFLYLNDTTGIKIKYEFSQAYIFITLYRLKNQRLEENPEIINKNTYLNGFGLDDLINLKNPTALVKPAYEYGEQSEYYNPENGMTLYVSQFAKNLSKYAIDVLKGDFRVFKDLDVVVKSRLM